MTEQEAQNEVLRRCRATGIGGWVMRKSDDKPCAVISLRETEVHPDGFILGHNGKRYRDRRIAVGDTWSDVLSQLPEETTRA